ncbi:MAG: hypothetical protein LAT58_00210 [Opitutales bacterium]|nr:hypothetical protein [Opitutales bacterium]
MSVISVMTETKETVNPLSKKTRLPNQRFFEQEETETAERIKLWFFSFDPQSPSSVEGLK